MALANIVLCRFPPCPTLPHPLAPVAFSQASGAFFMQILKGTKCYKKKGPEGPKSKYSHVNYYIIPVQQLHL